MRDDQEIRQLQQLQGEVYAAIYPWIEMKCEILNRVLPSIRFIKGSNQLPEVEYPEETKATLARIDELMKEAIDRVMARRGLPWQLPT
jgi:hypothetical protein